MTNPAQLLPSTVTAFKHLKKAIDESGLPERVQGLIQLRASQINGCSMCLNMHVQEAKQRGETDERLATVAAWREAPYFDEAEGAALALTEAATRLADKSSDAVSDEVWARAAEHYDEQQLAGIVLSIAAINFANRLNATIKQEVVDVREFADAS